MSYPIFALPPRKKIIKYKKKNQKNIIKKYKQWKMMSARPKND